MFDIWEIYFDFFKELGIFVINNIWRWAKPRFSAQPFWDRKPRVAVENKKGKDLTDYYPLSPITTSLSHTHTHTQIHFNFFFFFFSSFFFFHFHFHSQTQTMDTEDLADDLHSLSFASTNTTTKRSTSFSSETTTVTPSTSSHFLHPPLPNAKPHAPSSDPCASFIHRTRPLAFSHLRFTRRLGSGDMSAVYLAEPREEGGGAVFAAKVMEKEDLARRNKEGRARTEREILEMLDHPFLPTLYASIHAPKWLCFLTPFCPGGDLHVLRQRFPNKRFLESAVRCARRFLPMKSLQSLFFFVLEGRILMLNYSFTNHIN